MNKGKFKVLVAEIGGETVVSLKDIKISELEMGDSIIKELDSISADVTLRTTTLGITANFRVVFSATYDCVRCLEVFEKKTTSELLLLYSEGLDPLWDGDNIKLKSQDIERIYYQGPYIDLKQGIREAIILTVPIAALCAENCPGLCPICGKKKIPGACKCRVSSEGIFTQGFVKQKKKASETGK